jgi:creatinine amidohydrolase
MRPWVLSECNYAQVKAADCQVAVLPCGATEPHNLHLPYGTDNYEADAIGGAICRAAHEQGAGVMLLPTIPYGTETNQRAYPLSMNLNPSTLGAVIADLVESLAGQGVRKIVLLNSHGGNDLKPLLRELYGKTAARLFLCNWYQVARDVYDQIFDAPEDHAGEMETSLMLAYRPDLVACDASGNLAADEGSVRPTRFDAVNQGWVSITRPWHLLTTNAGSGNPHAATAEKGRRLMDLLVERLGTFLVELAAAELDEEFPF